MALTPTENEAFYREVDENLRRDQMTDLARRWGRPALIAVGVLLVALAASLWWKDHRAKQAGETAVLFSQVLNDVDAGKGTPNDPRLATLAQSPREGYSGLARLTQAGLSAQLDPAKGAAAYRAIADDSALPQPMRDLAMIRATTLEFDGIAPQQVVDRMKPLTVPGGAWFGSAGELTGAAYLKMNRRDLAGPLFAAIARDGNVPTSIRARASGLATSLGQSVTPATIGTAPKE